LHGNAYQAHLAPDIRDFKMTPVAIDVRCKLKHINVHNLVPNNIYVSREREREIERVHLSFSLSLSLGMYKYIIHICLVDKHMINIYIYIY